MKVLVFCALLATAAAWPSFGYGDAESFDYQADSNTDLGGASKAQKQHDVNMLLFKVYEDIRDPELKALEDSWDPLGANAIYDDENKISAHLLMDEYNAHHLLERKHWFSLFNPRQRKEALMLYDVLEYAHDWNTFRGNAAYFRKRMNEGEFVYAMYAAVTHAHITEHVVLPPLYEVTPHMFTNGEVIQEAYNAKMTQTPARIQSKFTGTKMNREQRVAYFGEDIGMNTHHVTWHLEFPFWWIDERENWNLERKGESFFWVHHQLTVRFDAERLSNYLEPVDELHWDDVIHEGFAPHTMYKYGGYFPSRPDNIHFEDVDGVARVRDMKMWEERIRDAIAHGYVYNRDGSHVDIRSKRGVEILGDVIESSMYSPNPEYYGSLHNTAHMMLGRQGDPHGKYDLPPGVLEHFETATRDPAFFRLHKYMDNIFREHKYSLPAYTKEEVEFENVEVTSIAIEGTLETYTEDFEYSLVNAVDDTAEIDDVAISTYIPRMNHKDFSFNIHINNKRSEHVIGTVRIFAWPKYDQNGVKLDINDGFWNAIELDKFWVDLAVGDNAITRKSSESAVTVPDIPSMQTLMDLADAALSSGSELHTEQYESGLGLPNRFLIPKGKDEGMEFVLLVAVTDGEHDGLIDGLVGNTLFKHYGYQGKFIDEQPFGFPLDRHVDDETIFEECESISHVDVKVYNHNEHRTL